MTISTEIIRGAEAIEKAARSAAKSACVDAQSTLFNAGQAAALASWQVAAERLALELGERVVGGNAEARRRLVAIASRASGIGISRDLAEDGTNALGVIRDSINASPPMAKLLAYDLARHLEECPPSSPPYP